MKTETHRQTAKGPGIFLVACFVVVGAVELQGAEHTLVSFERRELTDVYFSEGANAADLDRDGHPDVIYGPHWYAGPDFKTAHEIYPAVPQPRKRYADNFFTWPHDFDGDGWTDLLVVGLPGTPAFLYENPKGAGTGGHWKKTQVFDFVGNESPHLADLTGDDRPELICTREGVLGFAEFDPGNPTRPWVFRPVSAKIMAARFGHGLGVGDINGDGLADIIHAGGWVEQPGDPDHEGVWKHHAVKFTNAYGGAEMYAYDVDGDGDNDVVTSLAAHDFGLAWYEQVGGAGDRRFREHLIMGARPEQNRYGLVFSEPHSVHLTDIDGDGLKDIVTGKTYYSHHEKSPLWDAGAVVYWFRLVRGDDGVDWVPHRAAADTGIGRQITVSDVNGDRLPDIVVGGMKGGNVLLQEREAVDRERWLSAQPEPFEGFAVRKDRGGEVTFDRETGRVAGAIEGESMKVLKVGAGSVGVQKMGGFQGDRWSGGEQLFWRGGTPRARLDLEFEVPETGEFGIEASFTVARDYAIINVLLDDRALGEPLDLFHSLDVRTTGVLELGRRKLEAGAHKLTLETIGANESAVKKHMVGLDWLRLVSP